ncbi:transposase [Streptomyces sp. NPDC006544]|uniref:transposase n=1 Tax=Streptomyces sp. NPDC006544 TaxID=3154583 RepID=UPI0033B46E6E
MRHYPAEFKADAVTLYRSRPGATVKSVAGDLGVNTETLRNWIKAADGAPARRPLRTAGRCAGRRRRHSGGAGRCPEGDP